MIKRETVLGDFVEILQVGTERARKIAKTSARNAEMARIVAEETTDLASITVPLDYKKSYPIFRAACLETANAFTAILDKQGLPLPNMKERYGRTVDSTPGQIARKHLPELLASNGYTEDPGSLIGKTNFSDIVEISARNTGLHYTDMDPAQANNRLRELIGPEDFFHNEVQKIDVRTPPALNEKERKAVATALNLANATWKASQLPRAIAEGTPNRTDPNVRPSYNPYPVNLFRLWHRGVETSYLDGALLPAFEMYKDLLQYKIAPSDS